MAEKVEMYKCADGHLFDTKEAADKHDQKLDRQQEVDDFLQGDQSGYTRSGQKEILIPLWDLLRGHFKDSDIQRKIYNHCIDALMMEDPDHKQWFLEIVLSLVVDDFEETKARFNWRPSAEPIVEES